MPPSGEGETRAAYVIQRHFRRVRKGYDPAEVDRHLQLVSEWFRTSRAAEKTRELGEQSAARERAEYELEVIDKQPFEGPLFVRFGDDVHVFGGELAKAMRVEVAR